MSERPEIKMVPDAGEASVATDKYAEGYMRCKIVSLDITQSKKKDYLDVSPEWWMFKMKLKPLTDPEDEDSGFGDGFFTWQCLPSEPAHWEEKLASGELDEGTIQKWRRTLARVFTPQVHNLLSSACTEEEVPLAPHKENGELVFAGEPIEAQEYDDKTKEARDSACSAANRVCAGEEELLVGKVVYIRTQYDIDKETGDPSDFLSIKRWFRDVPTRSGREVDVLSGMDILA